MFHFDDITCADVKVGEGVVTATYSGELIFWKLETGQPYRRYCVSHPTEFIELKHHRDSDQDKDQLDNTQDPNNINVSRYVRKSISQRIRDVNKRKTSWSRSTIPMSKQLGLDNVGENQILDRIQSQTQLLPMSVQAVLFLQTRPMTKEHGKFLLNRDIRITRIPGFKICTREKCTSAL